VPELWEKQGEVPIAGRILLTQGGGGQTDTARL